MLRSINPSYLVFGLILLAAAVVSWVTGHDFVTGATMFGAVIAPQVSASDTSNLNTVAANYLEWVDQSKIYDMIWENNPTLTIIAKKADVGGAYVDQTVLFGGSGGTSNRYDAALGNQGPIKQATFHVPMSDLFHIGTLDGKAIEAARQKKGAFVPLVAEAMETGMKLAANKLSKQLLSSGTATLGQIVAVSVNPAGYPTGSAQITLASTLQYQQFEYGATYDITLSDGSAPLGAPDTVQVIGIDAGAALLVFAAPTTGAWNAGYFVAGNYIIQDGDYNATGFSGAISTQAGITGFQPVPFAGFGAWVPSYSYRTNPGLASAQFLNVPRNLDGTRLAGIGFNGSSMSIDKALTGASIQASIYNDEGGAPEYCSINPTSMNALLNQLQTQKFITDTISANISYENVLVLQGGGSKPMKVMQDRNVPARTAYLWSPDDFYLASIGGCPKPLPYGDLTFLPLADQNGMQYRVGGYSNLVCKNPRGVVNVTLQQ